jgi:hypothetical protein
MPSTQTALVVGSTQASIPKSNPPELYLLPFGKGLYTVPASAFMSYPKRANVMSSGDALGELLATKAPEKWISYCHPDTLCRVKGEGGSNCVYTTFSIEGESEERRFLRFVSATVAEKNFDKIKEQLAEEIASISNERQQIRFDVLNWKKLIDCPNRAQLSPELEKWPLVTGADVVKSVARAPVSKKRPKPGQAASSDSKQKFLKHEEFVEKPHGTTCRVIELDNLVHVLFYKKVKEEEVEEHDPNDI